MSSARSTTETEGLRAIFCPASEACRSTYFQSHRQRQRIKEAAAGDANANASPSGARGFTNPAKSPPPNPRTRQQDSLEGDEKKIKWRFGKDLRYFARQGILSMQISRWSIIHGKRSRNDAEHQHQMRFVIFGRHIWQVYQCMDTRMLQMGSEQQQHESGRE
jgi:hypothetical protein